MPVDFNVLSQMNANNPALMDQYQAANGNSALQQQIQDQYSSSLGGYAQNDRNAANAGHPIESTGYHFGIGNQTLAQQNLQPDSPAQQYTAPNNPSSQFGQGMSLQPNSPAVMPSLNKDVVSGLYTGFGGSSIAGPTPTTSGLPDFGVHSNQNQSTGNPQYNAGAGSGIGGTGVQSTSGLSNPNFSMPTGAAPVAPIARTQPSLTGSFIGPTGVTTPAFSNYKPITPAPLMRVPPVTAPVMNTLNRSVMRYSNPFHYKTY